MRAKESFDQLPELNSPYPEVRAAVPNHDDPLLPQSTVRVWVISLLIITIMSGATTLLSLHEPPVVLPGVISAILVWPIGKLWHTLVPNKTIMGFQLNPGPFNIKEHALMTIMAMTSYGTGPTYATEVIITTERFYKRGLSWAFRILFALSTQCMGLAFAGLSRRILVYPAALIWPNNLVMATLLTNIHVKSNYVANGWRISRLKFLVLAGLFVSAYQWLPSFLAKFLSNFSFGPWLAPENLVVNRLFGTISGAAWLPITFDWNQIAGYLGSPLVPPLFTLINVAAITVVLFWVIVPILHFTNIWFGDYVPFSASYLLDRYQRIYDPERVLDGNNFNLQQYQEYSPTFMSATMVVSYGIAFAGITATFVHCLLYNVKDVVRYWHSARDNPNDVHMIMMRRYPEVNPFYYVLLLIVCMILGAVLSKVNGELNVGNFFLALVVAAVFHVPAMVLKAVTNIELGLNVFSEFIIGYIQPGNAMAMMLFKTYCYNTYYTTMGYLENMKLGHYLKLKPWIVFQAQLISAIWGTIVQVVVLHWAKGNIDMICEPDQPLGYSCPRSQVFYSASIIWGLIGPARLFKLYPELLYFFILGAALPPLTWVWLRKWPRSLVRNIHWPVFFSCMGMLPPATLYNYGAYALVGLVFAYLIRRNYFNWWAKYNYTLSAAMDIGVVVGHVSIFVATHSSTLRPPRWWGNVGAFNNIDGRHQPKILLKEGETFGPDTW